MGSASRVVLIHWNAAEGEARAEALRRAGYRVEVLAPRGAPGLRPVIESPPAGVVIDLSRRPSDGLGIAILLRQRAASRRVPLVFAAGEPEKVARARALLPDAGFAGWSTILGALRRAIAHPPESPIVRGTMDPYAGAPLLQKLGIRPGSAVALLGTPAGFERTLGALPEGARLVRRADRADLIVLFARTRADLERRLPAVVRVLTGRNSLWIAWPKQASGVPGDLTQVAVRAAGMSRGLVDYKVASIDTTWSGLRFRRRDRRVAGRA